MAYRAGTRNLGPLGIPDDVPRVICDGCGLVHRIKPNRLPPMWMLDGKAPPKWRRSRDADGKRRDVCPRCIAGGVQL